MIPSAEKNRNLGRRNFSRLVLGGEVTVTFDGFVWRSNLLNIGGGGVFILSQRLLPVGTVVCVKFDLTLLAKRYESQAFVAWHRSKGSGQKSAFYPEGMGLEFIFLPLELRRIFDQFAATGRSLTGLDTRIGREVRIARD